MNNYLKQLGERGENIVTQYYQDKGYKIIDRNYCIRGGELDIVAKKGNNIIFIEVKTVSRPTDLYLYISKKKITILQKTIEAYVRKHTIQKPVRLDIVFVQNGKIIEHYYNITNN